MEELNTIETTEQPAIASKEIRAHLSQTAEWGKFLAIIGYVILGIMVLLAFLMMFALSGIRKTIPVFSPVILGSVYLIFTGIHFIPVTFLYRFSAEAKGALRSNDEEQYVAAFKNLKSLFKFMGIYTIVVMVLYGLFILLAVPLSMLFR